MFAYIVKRLISGLAVVILVSMSVFALFWFGPRNPAQPLCQLDTANHCTPKRLAEYTKSLGYDNSVVHEYLVYAKGVVAGREITLGPTKVDCHFPCFGVNYRTKGEVTDEFKQKFPATVSLAVGGAFLYLVIGVTVGVLAARRRGTASDRALVSGTLVMSSVPYYLVALLANLIFVISLGLFGTTGYVPITEHPLRWFSGLLLPWLVLGLYFSTAYTRYSRGSMVEALSEDYIRTAKAKGLSPRAVTFRHALRAAIVPVVTIFGLDFAGLLAGTIFTEKIFSINGIGYWGLQATYTLNLPVVSATVLLSAILVVLANLVVDVIYSVLDPRVRLS